jgi:hypothetical protein
MKIDQWADWLPVLKAIGIQILWLAGLAFIALLLLFGIIKALKSLYGRYVPGYTPTGGRGFSLPSFKWVKKGFGGLWSFMGGLIKFLLVLAIIFACIAGGTYLFKRGSMIKAVERTSHHYRYSEGDQIGRALIPVEVTPFSIKYSFSASRGGTTTVNWTSTGGGVWTSQLGHQVIGGAVEVSNLKADPKENFEAWQRLIVLRLQDSDNRELWHRVTVQR